MKNPFDVPYLAWHDHERKYWIGVENEQVVTTDEMRNKLAEGQRAYVVNHRGYKSFITFDENKEMIWKYPPMNYISDFYILDEDNDKLKWIIKV